MKDIETLSEALDSRFQWRGFRFGWDSLIGLIPVIGDLFTTGASLYIVGRAYSIGVPFVVILKMLLNIGVETVVGFIPVVGNIFDFVWRSNLKNIDLILAYQQEPGSIERRSWITVGLFGGALLFTLVGFAYILFRFVGLLFSP